MTIFKTYGIVCTIKKGRGNIMISLTELKYVSSWAKKTPYPGEEYCEETMVDLERAFQEYQNHYMNCQYEIAFSNGTQIFFELLDKNLSHIFGIDYKNLKDDYFQSFRKDVLKLGSVPTSYDLLQSILEHKDAVLLYDYEHREVLNYYKIRIKCEIFNKLSDFQKFDFGCVDFNTATYEKNNPNGHVGNSSKYFFLPSQEIVCPYFMMGLVEDPKVGCYCVESLLAPADVKGFMQDQTLIIPTHIIVSSENSVAKYSASAREKLALLNMCKSLVEQYQLPNRIDIFGDYFSILAEQERANTKALIK